MKLHELRPAKGAVHKEKRLGRGEASGHGGTSTKGNKGGQSRTGYKGKGHMKEGRCPFSAESPSADLKILTG